MKLRIELYTLIFGLTTTMVLWFDDPNFLWLLLINVGVSVNERTGK